MLANLFPQLIDTDEIPKELSLTTAQISAHFSRKMKGVQLSPIWMNINFYQTGNMLLEKDIELCEPQLTTVK